MDKEIKILKVEYLKKLTKHKYLAKLIKKKIKHKLPRSERRRYHCKSYRY